MGEWVHIGISTFFILVIYYCVRFVVRSIGKFMRGEPQ